MCYVHNQWYEISCATLYLGYIKCGTDVLADRARPKNFARTNSYIFQTTGSRSDQVARSVNSELKIT